MIVETFTPDGDLVENPTVVVSPARSLRYFNTDFDIKLIVFSFLPQFLLARVKQRIEL